MAYSDFKQNSLLRPFWSNCGSRPGEQRVYSPASIFRLMLHKDSMEILTSMTGLPIASLIIE